MLAPHRLRHQHPDVLPDDLCGRVTEEALGGRAEGVDGSGLIDDDHGLGHGVEDRTEMCLTGAQVRLGLLLLVDGEDDTAVMGRSAIRIECHAPTRAQPEDLPIRPHSPVVDLVTPALPQRPLDGLRPGWAVLRMHQGLSCGESSQLLGGNAEEAGASR